MGDDTGGYFDGRADIGNSGDFQEYDPKAALAGEDRVSATQDREKAICFGCRVL